MPVNSRVHSSCSSSGRRRLSQPVARDPTLAPAAPQGTTWSDRNGFRRRAWGLLPYTRRGYCAGRTCPSDNNTSDLGSLNWRAMVCRSTRSQWTAGAGLARPGRRSPLGHCSRLCSKGPRTRSSPRTRKGGALRYHPDAQLLPIGSCWFRTCSIPTHGCCCHHVADAGMPVATCCGR